MALSKALNTTEYMPDCVTVNVALVAFWLKTESYKATPENTYNISCYEYGTIIIIMIITINPLTARVVGAPRMILPPVFFIFPLFPTDLWDLPNSRPAHSLMLSSHLFLCLHSERGKKTSQTSMVYSSQNVQQTQEVRSVTHFIFLSLKDKRFYRAYNELSDHCLCGRPPPFRIC